MPEMDRETDQREDMDVEIPAVMNPPVRIRVLGVDKSELGLGYWTENVTTHAVWDPKARVLMSRLDPTIPMADDEVPEGAERITVPDDPKLVMDSGEVFYGCQVWWEVVKDG
jgi:hypothetical protein